MIEILGVILAIFLSIPLWVLIVESILALFPLSKKPGSSLPDEVTCATLIPAHNEEGSISATVLGICSQIRPGDRVIVIADNCSDRTADKAREAGASAIERNDLTKRGKGYALDFGVRYLESNPPDIVFLIDADCSLKEGSYRAILADANQYQRPIQAFYLLTSPDTAVRNQVSSFAFFYKNLIRPTGMARLGLPCHLTGSGMAFPWPVLRDAPLASGNIVEDLQLGLDLAIRGKPARFCPEAMILSEIPAGKSSAEKQRKRWEHGHLQTVLNQVPRLLFQSLRQLRPELAGLALDLSVPPLSLLFLMIIFGVLLLCVLGWLSGFWYPLMIMAGSALIAFLLIFLVWVRFGQKILPMKSLLAVPFYILWKIPIYLGFITHRERSWNRTDRNQPTAPETKG